MNALTTLKNAEISRRILVAYAANGGNLRAAFDEVLGQGAYSKLAGDVYDALNARAA